MVIKLKLLVVEDNEMILKGLKYYLESEKFIISTSSNYNEAIEKLELEKYDLVILDVSLPDGNGFDLCKYIKENYNYPVIFLTARDDTDDIVYGLELADEYMVKPFRNRELLMRIKKILNMNNIIQFKNIKIDTEKLEVYKDDKLVNLTTLEFKLFLTLVNNKNKVLSRDFLLDKIEDETGNFVNDNTLRVYVKRIREKIESEDIIRTVKGIGYIVDEK